MNYVNTQKMCIFCMCPVKGRVLLAKPYTKEYHRDGLV